MYGNSSTADIMACMFVGLMMAQFAVNGSLRVMTFGSLYRSYSCSECLYGLH